MQQRILVVEDDPAVLNLLVSTFRNEGYLVDPCSNGGDAIATIRQKDYDLVVTDIVMEGVDGLQVLAEVQSARPQTPVILLTGYGSVESAVQAMKGGAYDYVTKPFKLDELLLTVQRALKYRAVLMENLWLQWGTRLPFLVAESSAMRQICEVIQRVAPTDSTVLITGESGTGKEVVARAIHALSPRRNRVFVPINCGAMPETLLESEMFGHVKGAFTGATADKIGLFESAHGGTILLDEINAMPLNLQVKLLRVLQDKCIRKVGSTETYPVDVRVLVASNQPLEPLIEQGRFREDLYYRISVIPIHLPPLRERREDIMPLVAHFLRRERPAGAPLPKLDPQAQRILEAYHWPGNVRELENAIRHALTFMQGDTITPDVLPTRIVQAAAGVELPSTQARSTEPSTGEEFRGRSLKAFLRQKEREYVQMVVDKMGGDKVRAAAALRISLTTLYRKLAGDVE